MNVHVYTMYMYKIHVHVCVHVCVHVDVMYWYMWMYVELLMCKCEWKWALLPTNCDVIILKTAILSVLLNNRSRHWSTCIRAGLVKPRCYWIWICTALTGAGKGGTGTHRGDTVADRCDRCWKGWHRRRRVRYSLWAAITTCLSATQSCSLYLCTTLWCRL